MKIEEVISNVHVYGLDDAMRGSKYSMAVDVNKVSEEITPTIKKLAACGLGQGHDNFLNGVIVQFDLTFTNKAWVEAERYHFLDFVSSQSTMHRITRFDLYKSYIEYTDSRIIEIMKEKVNEYNSLKETDPNNPTLNEKYLEILYSNPAGFKITAKMTTNYRQLKTIYPQRRYHRLPEWRTFCEWIETLPESYLITAAAKKEA